MILFPTHFVKIEYPGYYWNTKENRLYSIKPNGVLKELRLKKDLRRKVDGLIHVQVGVRNYSISHNGKRKQ